MPCQMPPTSWIVVESRRAMTRSMPGSTPSLSTPSTSPVNGVGVTPCVTVRPLTACPAVSSAMGYATAQSPVSAAECAACTVPTSTRAVGTANARLVRRATRRPRERGRLIMCFLSTSAAP